MPRALKWTSLVAELECLYRPPCGAPRTWSKLQGVIRDLTSLGVKTTGDLNPGLIARFVESKAHCRPETIRGYLSYIGIVTKLAISKGLIRKEADPVKYRKDWTAGIDVDDDELEAERDARHLSLDQVMRLLDYTGRHARTSWKAHRLHAMTALFAYTGLRRDEGLNLKVIDLDLAARFVRIRRRRRRRVKTKGSAAPVPMPPALVEVLEEWLPLTGCEWAFPGARLLGPWKGGEQGKRPYDALRLAGEEAGLGVRVNFLVLRHTYATLGEHFRLGERQLTRILRHTRPLTAREHYRHADLDGLRTAVESIDFRAGSRFDPTVN